MKSCKLRMRVKFNILVRTILLVSCISNVFTSWHCLLKSQSMLHGYLLSTYRCGIRIFSAKVWSQGGANYTASLFRSTITGVVVQGFRSSSIPVTHEGYLVSVLPPFPHRFQVPVTLVPTVQPFCPASLVS